MRQKETELPRELESIERISFLDCDPFGHLNNSRYIDYFYNARVDQLREHLDFDIYELGKETGKNWVVAGSQISYFYPALYNAEVIITTKMIYFSPFRVTAEYTMTDLGRTRLHSVLWSDFIYVSMKTGKPAKHPPDMMELFQKIVFRDPGLDLKDFNARTKTLQKSFR